MSLLKILLRANLAGLVFFMATAAIGQNTMFLRNSLLAELKPEEMDSLLAAITQTLDQEQLNKPLIWENESRTISSSIAAVDAYQKDSLACRQLTLTTTTNSAQSVTQYGFCKVDGIWLMDSE
jgi:surface antigen